MARSHRMASAIDGKARQQVNGFNLVLFYELPAKIFARSRAVYSLARNQLNFLNTGVVPATRLVC